MKKLCFALMLIGCLVACKKQETESPVVTLFSPTASDTFFVNDSVNIHFSISDKNLRSYKIIISNFFNKKIYYKEEGAVSGNDFSVDKKVFFEINADTSTYLNVLGIDENGNTSDASSRFEIKK